MDQARLYISILIDNSASMEETKLAQIIKGFEMIFKSFEEEQSKGSLQIQVLSFGDFQPQILKQRTESSYSEQVILNGFPLMGRALDVISKDLMKALTNEKKEIHTPWLIVISNGLTLDSIQKSHLGLKALKAKYNLRYLPFLTTREKVASRQIETEQFEAKKPMVILDKKMDLFFHWLTEDIKNRINTPLNERVTSDKKLLEGWTIL
jgi:uncharacterized protein YegL